MDRKHFLIRLIINAGLEEEFIDKLKQRGYVDLYGRLEDIPLEVIEEFVHEKRLLIEEDVLSEIIRDINSIDYYEIPDKKIKSRKI